MLFLANLISLAVDIYILIIILEVIVHWLIIFDVFDAKNPKAQLLLRNLKKATEPVMKPLREVIPPVGGLDITPIAAILLLGIARSIVITLLFSAFY